jgi:putative PIN family toxin of toxin-antitoxin system
MIRAVIDVNVLVSGLIGPLGYCRAVMTAWEQERIAVITAEGIISELDGTLILPRLRKWLPDPDTNRRWVRQLLQSQAHLIVVPPSECRVLTGDPEDDYVLATTRLSQANYLVTGDKKLLGLKDYAGAKIVSPREFVSIIESP